MEPVSYTVEKLRGSKNWVRFECEMEAIFIMDDCWEVVSGEELEPTPPKAPTQGPEIGTTDSSSQTIASVTNEWYQKELKAWRKKNRKAMARLTLSTEDGPREHIRNLKTIREQWTKLKEQYGATGLSTRDAALSATHIKSSAYKSIQEYTAAIKKHQTALTTMGVALPAWQLSTFFRMGLEEGPEPYIFQLIQGAKTSRQELGIDEMTTALSESKRRVNLHSGSKA